MKTLNGSLPKITVSYHRNKECVSGPVIKDSFGAYELFLSLWNTDTIELYEEFKVLYLDRKNTVMGYRNLSRGSTSGTTVNVKLLVGIALECNAEGIILCHNHPSGNKSPSESDRKMTSKVSRACLLFDISLLDHIILIKDGYTSMADENTMF